MPKPARFMLIWSDERDLYELYEYGRPVLQANGTHWLDWLNTHTSFAFRGKQDHFNLLKEWRKQSSESYWYAYQRQGKRTTKRYVGKSSEVVPARLEEIEGAFRSTQSTFPLLVAKFQLPRLSPALLLRERLLALLDLGLQRSLTLVSAPAGSGKTTLVTQWIAARREEQQDFPSIAWISLDKSDNDLIRFWHYVIAACNVFRRGCGQTALRQLAALSTFPPETTLLDAALTHFLNDLARSACNGLLILDDYQVITAPHIHRSLAFFLEHLPPSVHLILITRHEPAFPLVRLRVQEDVVEITTHDLRFSRTETAAFFQQCFPSLSFSGVIEQLDVLLEGWATGLRLFALSLQSSPTEEMMSQHLTAFMNGHRSLHEYFLEEVFDTLTASQQQFLLHTCLLNRLTASLCDAVMGKRDSAVMLRSLERVGLFLERLDGPGQWYRYHPLFAEIMREEAGQRFDEQTRRTILLRAGRWYEQEGLLTEAIELALQAQEPAYAATMIERYLARRSFDDMHEFSTLRCWLEQLPTDILSLYPLLCLHYAQALSLSSMPEQPSSSTLAQMKELLCMAKLRWRAEDNVARLGEVYAFQAYLAMRQHEPEQVCIYARQALEWLPRTAQHWRGVCLNLLSLYPQVDRWKEETASSSQHATQQGSADLETLKLSNDIDNRIALLQEALVIWTDLHHIHGARSSMLLLATLYFEQGALQLAAACYRHVVREAREFGDREDLIPALVGLAQLSYEWNDLASAERAAQEAREVSEQMGSQELLMRSTFVLIQIWFLQGQKMLVQQCFASLLAQFSARPDLSAEVRLCQIRYWLAEGDVATVQHRLSTLIIPEGNRYTHLRERQQLLQIRLFLKQKRYHRAFEELERLQMAAQQDGRGRLLLEVRLLLAMLYLAQQQIQPARQTLEAALLFAHTEGYLRSFLDEGREIATLLRMLYSYDNEPSVHNYLQTILQAFEPDRVIPRRTMMSVEPLSRQEQRVLRLIVAELSYPEIARELTVSLNTVKTHVNNIYRKLNVHSRREARAVVRDLQLFSS